MPGGDYENIAIRVLIDSFRGKYMDNIFRETRAQVLVTVHDRHRHRVNIDIAEAMAGDEHKELDQAPKSAADFDDHGPRLAEIKKCRDHQEIQQALQVEHPPTSVGQILETQPVQQSTMVNTSQIMFEERNNDFRRGGVLEQFRVAKRQ